MTNPLASMQEVAASLTDWEFEHLLRIRVRAGIARLEEWTKGYTSYNSITFALSGENGEWRVICGTTYGNTHSSEGEILSRTINAALGHMAAISQAKLNLLTGPSSSDDGDETT